jgi:hypothetical protein
MRLLPWLARRRIDLPCTIEIEQTADFFYAHLTLDEDIEIQPGDRVRVQGEPIRVAFGDSLLERRIATVERANSLGRAWTRFAARFQLAELYEVSFTPGRTL